MALEISPSKIPTDQELRLSWSLRRTLSLFLCNIPPAHEHYASRQANHHVIPGLSESPSPHHRLMHVVFYIETSLLRAKLVEVSRWCLPTSPLYLLHGKLERGFAIREFHSNAGALNFSHNIVQLLRLLQHLPVAAAKLPKHTVGHVGDAVCRVAQRAPQSLKYERTFIESLVRQQVHSLRPQF